MAGNIPAVALSDNWLFSQQQLFPGCLLFPAFFCSHALNSPLLP